jgi:hypothetical protein
MYQPAFSKIFILITQTLLMMKVLHHAATLFSLTCIDLAQKVVVTLTEKTAYTLILRDLMLVHLAGNGKRSEVILKIFNYDCVLFAK